MNYFYISNIIFEKCNRKFVSGLKEHNIDFFFNFSNYINLN